MTKPGELLAVKSETAISVTAGWAMAILATSDKTALIVINESWESHIATLELALDRGVDTDKSMLKF